MNAINERIAKCIEALGIKKSHFAKALNVSQAFVSQLTKGVSSPSDRTIADICREFNVNEIWLRTGEGEMFVKKEPQPLDKLLSELLDGQTVTDEDRVLVKNFLELPDASRKAVIEFVQKCAGELSAPAVDAKTATTTTAPPAGKDIPVPATAPDLAAKVAELERQNQKMMRQNQELAVKVAAMEEEDALLGLTGGFSISPGEFAGNLNPNEKNNPTESAGYIERSLL